MARDENMPFPLGSTFFGGDTDLINANVGFALEGQEFWVEDDDESNGSVGASTARSGRKRKVRVVRNMNATALSGKEVAKLKVNGSTVDVFCGQVDGKCASVADKGYPVDEFLASGGCKQYDLCYVVVDGLAKVVTDTSGDTNISLGSVVIPGATTAGRVIDLDTSATGATLFNQVFNALGRAAEAVNATSATFTVDVGGHTRH